MDQLNTHDIRLGQIYFHLTLLIRYFVLTDKVLGDPGDKMTNYTAFFPGWINAISLISTASILPYSSPLKPPFKQDQLDIFRWEGGSILSLAYPVIYLGCNILGVRFPLGGLNCTPRPAQPILLYTQAATYLGFNTFLDWVWIVWLYSWIAFVWHDFTDWEQ